MHSQNERLNVAPTVNNKATFQTADATGTTNDPYLDFAIGTLWAFVGVSNEVAVATTAHALVTTGISGTLAAGDLLVACITSRIASTTSVTLPTGGEWTLVAEQKNNNTLTTSSALPSGLMAYCVRGASNPNLTFTHPVAPSQAQGRIVAYRNVNTSSPLDTQTSFTTAINTLGVSGTGLTTTQIEDLIVAMACGGQEAAWSAFDATDPTGASGATVTTAPTTAWSERADNLVTTGADGSLAIFDAVKLTSGATGNLTATASVSAGHVVIAGAFKIFPSTADAWDGADKSATVTLSNSDKTATASSSAGGVRSTTSHALGTAGKYYAELSFDNLITTDPAGGIKDKTGSLTGTLTAVYVIPFNGNIFNSGTLIGNVGSSLANGDVVCLAVDMGAERVWFRKANGLWNNNAAADPATGANGLDISSLANNAFGLWAYNSGGGPAGLAVTLRTESAEFTYTGPSGFTSWMGEALAAPDGVGDADGIGTAAATGTAIKSADASSASGAGAASATGTGIKSADASMSAGVGTAAATGSSITILEGAGDADGIGAASAAGTGIKSANTSTAAGVGAASATGVALAIAAGTAAGIGAASATGTGIAVSVGTAAGIGAATAEGTTVGVTSSGQGTAAGVGAATATGTGIKSATASTASGLGTATATATATAASAGTAAGIGAASGVGFSITVVAGAGDADGIGAATATGRATGASAGDADGIGTAAATATATAASAGTATGTGAALALSDPGTTTGEATGQGTAVATGRAITVAVGAAFGVGSASATGAVIAAGVGTASGIGTAAAVSEEEAGVIAEGVGTAAGVGEAIGRALEEQLPIAGGGGVGVRFRPRPAVIEGVGYAVLPELVGFALGEVGYRPKLIAGRAKGIIALGGHCVCDVGVKGAAYSIARLPLMASATMDAGSAGQAEITLKICTGVAMGDHDPDEHVVIALMMAA